MIEPCFNELSIYPLCTTDEDMEQRLATFVNLLKEIKKYGIKKVRYESSFHDIKLKENCSLQDYCNQASTSQERDRASFLYSTLRRPYLDEDKEELFYIYDNCELEDGDETKNCMGMYVAALMKSFAVGFNSVNQATHPKLYLYKNTGTVEIREICCLSLPEHTNIQEFIDLMSAQSDLPVPKSTLEANQKKKHLSVHHGKHECNEHAEQLLKNPYVNEILNTIDFNPKETSYIHNVKAPNLIEVRLIWTKAGYGLCVSTTAENIIQNHWIANLLKKQYED